MTAKLFICNMTCQNLSNIQNDLFIKWHQQNDIRKTQLLNNLLVQNADKIPKTQNDLFKKYLFF